MDNAWDFTRAWWCYLHTPNRVDYGEVRVIDSDELISLDERDLTAHTRFLLQFMEHTGADIDIALFVLRQSQWNSIQALINFQRLEREFVDQREAMFPPEEDMLMPDDEGADEPADQPKQPPQKSKQFFPKETPDLDSSGNSDSSSSGGSPVATTKGEKPGFLVTKWWKKRWSMAKSLEKPDDSYLWYYKTSRGTKRWYKYKRAVDWTDPMSLIELDKWRRQIRARMGKEILRGGAVRFLPEESKFIWDEFKRAEEERVARRAAKRNMGWADVTRRFNQRFQGRILPGADLPRPNRTQKSLHTQFCRLTKKAKKDTEIAAKEMRETEPSKRGRSDDELPGDETSRTKKQRREDPDHEEDVDEDGGKDVMDEE
jgi:hypothetical protein